MRGQSRGAQQHQLAGGCSWYRWQPQDVWSSAQLVTRPCLCGLASRLYDPIGGEHMNVMKGGLECAHRLVAVSHGYAWECQTPVGVHAYREPLPCAASQRARSPRSHVDPSARNAQPAAQLA